MPLYRQFVDAFRIHGPTDSEVWITFFLLLGIIAVFLLRGIWLQKMLEIRSRQGALRRFLTACRERGCVRDEINFLVNKVHSIGQEPSTALVESNVVFDNFAGLVLASANEQEAIQLNSNLTTLRNKFGFRPPPLGLVLNSTRELGVGQVLYVVLSEFNFLEGLVGDVDENVLTLQLSAGQPRKRIASGSEVWIHFNRSGDARYSGACRVFRSVSKAGGQYLVLEHCTELKRDQRREDFRVEEHRTVALWIIDQQLKEAEDPFSLLEDRIPDRALLEDLSGGGASIIYTRRLPVNQGVYINLDPGGTYGLPILRGTVIRANRRTRLDRWAISLRFEDLRPSERQYIVRHVFQREREQM